ncbi:ribonuclease R [Benzoatithermus flavus]|uniref:Ribonuclease R n=1 Tax=Benzoatithermus flavus TaxID=3108223 RepID=A0ABU8XNM8_9PROT
MAVRRRSALPPPTREEVVRFLERHGEGLGRNEILKALARERGDRAIVKDILRELAAEGLFGRRRRKAAAGTEEEADRPRTAVVDVAGIDHNGDLLLEHPELPHLRIVLPAERLRDMAPGVGDRLLARLVPSGEGELEARPLRLLPHRPTSVTGVVEAAHDGYRIRSADRRARAEFMVAASELGGADVGDLVVAEIVPSRRLGLARARVKERIGRPDDPRVLSLMTAVAMGLPMTFPPEAAALAAAARPVALGRREDLRHVDLVTIDGEDARDFDDAVWAAPDPSPGNPGGHTLLVAIADVAHYVRPNDALDREARNRGNSVYFPDRVIPMLPEALSNDLCSLRPNEDRACLAVWITIDRRGEIKSWRFCRGLMRSRARLTYRQVQAARDGNPDAVTEPLLEPVIGPLYAAFERLLEARHRRGTIELELPERKIVFDETGRIHGVEARERLASHMLIEEFMIAANVAAARELAEHDRPCLYRVHDKPDPVKLEALAQFLEHLGMPWSRTAKQPGDFTRLLRNLAEHELREMVSAFVLRSQAQAVYSPRNIGHFGLHLKRYAHFTSPIRRYSDLVVHRALIRHLGLGPDGLHPAIDEAQLASLGDHLSRMERRAMEAERRAFERLVAQFLVERVGAVFHAQVTSVVYFGLFVTLDEIGAEGLVPVSTLGDEAFLLDERHQALVGQRTGESFALGDRVKVELVEADPVQGTLLFRLEEHEPGRGAQLASTAWRKAGPPRKGSLRRIGRSARPRRRH